MGILNAIKENKALREEMSACPETKMPTKRGMEVHIYRVSPNENISWSQVHEAAYGAQHDVQAVSVGGPDMNKNIIRIQVIDGKDLCHDPLYILCYVLDNAEIPGCASDQEVQSNANMRPIIQAMLAIDPAVVDAMQPLMIIHNIQGDTASNAVRML